MEYAIKKEFQNDETQEALDNFYNLIKKDDKAISCDRDIEIRCMDMQIMSKEIVRIFFLDSQNRVIHTHDIMSGTVDQCTVYPRDIFQIAFTYDAASIAMAHNHPGGCKDPSDADWRITERIQTIGKGLDINLIDHVIIHGQGVTAMRGKSRWGNF